MCYNAYLNEEEEETMRGTGGQGCQPFDFILCVTGNNDRAAFVCLFIFRVT